MGLAAAIANLKAFCGYCMGRGTIRQTYDDYGVADPKDVPCWYCAKLDALLVGPPLPEVPHFTISRRLLDTPGDYYNAERTQRVKESAAMLQRSFDTFVRQVPSHGSDLVLLWEHDFKKRA